MVLVGTPDVHRLLYALDEDVRDLFRVRAEFDVDVPWSDDRIRDYAGFVANCVRQHELRHFDARRVARVVEHGARVAGDQRKLTARFDGIAELVAEASHWAGSAGRDVVTRADVEQALERRIHRANLVEERIDELIADGTLMIAVDGERVGPDQRAVRGRARRLCLRPSDQDHRDDRCRPRRHGRASTARPSSAGRSTTRASLPCAGTSSSATGSACP